MRGNFSEGSAGTLQRVLHLGLPQRDLQDFWTQYCQLVHYYTGFSVPCYVLRLKNLTKFCTLWLE